MDYLYWDGQYDPLQTSLLLTLHIVKLCIGMCIHNYMYIHINMDYIYIYPTNANKALSFFWIHRWTLLYICTVWSSKFQKNNLKTSGCLLDPSKVHETFGKLANGSPVTSTCSRSWPFSPWPAQGNFLNNSSAPSGLSQTRLDQQKKQKLNFWNMNLYRRGRKLSKRHHFWGSWMVAEATARMRPPWNDKTSNAHDTCEGSESMPW